MVWRDADTGAAALMDARLPVQWLVDRRIQRLSDADYRAFVNALIWAVANKTDGVVDDADLALIAGISDTAPAAFVAAELWTALENGWLITDFASTQTSRSEHEVLAKIRDRERLKKQRQRAANAAEEPAAQSDVPRDSTEGHPRDAYPVTAQAGRQAGSSTKSNQPGEGELRARVREKPNSARENNQPSDGDSRAKKNGYSPTDAERRLIDENVRRGYE